MADQPTDKTTTSTTSTEDFETIKKRAQDMVDEHEARNKQFDLMERAYKVQPSGSGQGSDAEGATSAPRARALYDPHPHNAINRIVQMYTANPPSVDIPVASAEKAESPETATKLTDQKRAADKAQEFLKALLHASDQVSEKSLIADMLYAACIYGEVPAIIDNLMEGEQFMPDGLDTPFVFEAMHPKTSFPRYSRRGGLYQHVYQLTTTIGAIRRDYDAAADFLTGEDSTEATLNDYVDATQHCVWVDEQASQALIQIGLPKELASVPRVSRIVSGGPGFLEKEEERRMPFLYAMVKSGLWAARNTLFTIFQTNAIDFLNPRTLAHMHPGREGEAPHPDWAERGGVEVVQVGETIEPYPFHSIPAELLQFNLMTTQLTEESTLSRISSGAAPGGVFAASGLNLMATLSRQATFMIARAVESALEQMLTRTLKWVAVGDYRPEVWSENGVVALTPADLLPLGKHYRVRVTLKPDQQSERQMVVALSRMLREMGLGYEDFLRPMEEGQIIESVSAAIERIKERAIMDAELPKVAAQSAKIADALMGITETIPEMPQGVPPEGLGANLGAGQGVPPGIMTPDQINPMRGQPPVLPPQMPPGLGGQGG